MSGNRLVPAAILLVLWLGWLPAACAQQAERTVFLVAKPGMPDPNFRESVVLVTQSDNAQTVGVIINRPTSRSLSAILPGDRFKQFTEPVFFGGPVAPQGLFAVYRTDRNFGEALTLLPGLYLALHPATLDELLRSPPRSIRFYAGYSGWAPGQLAAEIRRGDWYALDVDADLVFTTDTRGLWSRLVRMARAVTATLTGSAYRPLSAAH